MLARTGSTHGHCACCCTRDARAGTRVFQAAHACWLVAAHQRLAEKQGQACRNVVAANGAAAQASGNIKTQCSQASRQGRQGGGEGSQLAVAMHRVQKHADNTRHLASGATTHCWPHSYRRTQVPGPRRVLLCAGGTRRSTRLAVTHDKPAAPSKHQASRQRAGAAPPTPQCAQRSCKQQAKRSSRGDGTAVVASTAVCQPTHSTPTHPASFRALMRVRVRITRGCRASELQLHDQPAQA